MCGPRAALCIFLEMGIQERDKAGGHWVLCPKSQPANVWWGERMRKSCSPLLLVASLWAFGALSVKQRHKRKRRLLLEKLGSHFQQSQRSVPNTSVFCCCRNPLKSSWPIKYKVGNDERLCKCTVAVLVGNGLNPWMAHVVLTCLATADSLCPSWGWTCRSGWAFLVSLSSNPHFYGTAFYLIHWKAQDRCC